MRASPLMLAIALGIGLPQASTDASARPAPVPQAKAAELSRWIVVFQEAPAGNFRGFDPDDRLRPKLAASHHSIRGGERYDSRSPEARAYVDYLDDLRKMRLADYSARLGRQLEPIYTYVHATNGVALMLDAEEAALLRTMPGVASVSPDFKRRLQTDYGPGWINADDIWSGAATGSPHRGEGSVVGVIDSGINRSHVAFSGAGHANPLGGYRGYCVSVPSACNNKLVGLWDFTVGNNGLAPGADTDGHGTHVAATAAGAEFGGMSGVAPRANIISYKACPDDGDGCDGTALVRSIDQAVADGVDVINYSIGGDSRDPWAYTDSDAFLNARDAGVVASVAAGNQGPDFGSLNSPSNSPWVFSVAAASHNRNGPTTADILAGFSGRGGVIPFSVLKPDLTAPGVQIVSASNVGTLNTALKSGTSMATPHVAGAVALLKSVNPSLGADQLMSALQLTARPSVRRATILDLADPHHQGSGMVDVAKATQAGIFLPVVPGSFAAARSSVFTGGAQNLNLPSLAHGGCFIGCSVSRTFRAMPGAAGTTYTVQASFPAGATITPSVTSFSASNAGTTVNFSFSVQDADLVGDWVYGEVRLVNTSGNGRPDLRLPVAVYFSPSSNEAGIPAEIVINASHERGFHDVSFGDLVPLPNARFVASNLPAPVVQTRNIPVDPTNDDAFDDVQQNYIETFQIPAGEGVKHRVRISTQAAVPDIDLFVGRDTNNNGLPSKGEVRCESRSPQSAELCDFTVAGTSSVQTFWMMVQNWTGPGTNVRISRAVASSADGDGQALVATGPGHVDTNEDFTVRIGYDDPGMGPGQERLGFLKLQPSPGATAVEIPVRVTRTGATPSPFALAPGKVRKVWLEPGAAHERLVFDVPANATAVSFQTQGTGSVSLYAVHVANPTGPGIQPAPARGAPGVLSATGPGGNKTIAVSGANLQPGRWYVTPVNTGAASTLVDVSAVITTSTGSLKVKGGSYYPPARGGHGLFMYPAGAEQVVIWYTFLQDGTPTWYYMQAPQPGTNGSWTTPIYRAAWNGTANHLVRVGEAVMSASSDIQFSFAYNLDGFTGVESMDAFLVGCPSINGMPVDASGNWFDPVRAGSGYSVQLNPNYEFFAAFIYDDLGLPRFLLAERSGAFNAGANSLQLDQLQGFAPLGAHSTPVRSPVGTLSRQFTANALSGISVNASFANGIAGSWNANDAVVPLGNTQGCP